MDETAKMERMGVMEKTGTKNICSKCGGNAEIAMTSWKDDKGRDIYKKGERVCLVCHKKITGVDFSIYVPQINAVTTKEQRN